MVFPGDTIVCVNSKYVEDQTNFLSKLEKARPGPIAFTVLRSSVKERASLRKTCALRRYVDECTDMSAQVAYSSKNGSSTETNRRGQRLEFEKTTKSGELALSNTSRPRWQRAKRETLPPNLEMSV